MKGLAGYCFSSISTLPYPLYLKDTARLFVSSPVLMHIYQEENVPGPAGFPGPCKEQGHSGFSFSFAPHLAHLPPNRGVPPLCRDSHFSPPLCSFLISQLRRGGSKSETKAPGCISGSSFPDRGSGRPRFGVGEARVGAPSLRNSRSWVAQEDAGKTLSTPGKRERCDNIPAKKGK